MRSLSEIEIKRKAEIERKLDDALSKVENAQDAYNTEMHALWQKYMAPAFEQLNAALSEAEEFRAEVEDCRRSGKDVWTGQRSWQVG